jgi:hypothetical protein
VTDFSDSREMDSAHCERACRLLRETGVSPGNAPAAVFLTAYNAVLAKDLLFAVTELLIYKQNEVHR